MPGYPGAQAESIGWWYGHDTVLLLQPTEGTPDTRRWPLAIASDIASIEEFRTSDLLHSALV